MSSYDHRQDLKFIGIDLCIMQSDSLAIGVDVGGSHILCVTSTSTGCMVSSLRREILDRSVDAVIALIINAIAAIMSPEVKAIGMAIPGNVDPVRGCTRYLPNFQWYDEVPIGSIISERFGLPVELRNDGRCAAIAEYQYGQGKGSKVFAMLTLGTGIGGALVIDGKLFDGSSFDAGDFGHHVICSGADAFACVCGKSGCFEYHASADGLIRHLNLTKSLATDTLPESFKDIKSAYDFFLEYNKHPDNPILSNALSSYKKDLATGLANLVTFYNPDIICLGGGLAQAREIFTYLEAMVDARTLPATRGKVKIVAASLGTDAGALGAAMIGFQALLQYIC
jgi:glucokinase